MWETTGLHEESCTLGRCRYVWIWPDCCFRLFILLKDDALKQDELEPVRCLHLFSGTLSLAILLFNKRRPQSVLDQPHSSVADRGQICPRHQHHMKTNSSSYHPSTSGGIEDAPRTHTVIENPTAFRPYGQRRRWARYCVRRGGGDSPQAPALGISQYSVSGQHLSKSLSLGQAYSSVMSQAGW